MPGRARFGSLNLFLFLFLSSPPPCTPFSRGSGALVFLSGELALFVASVRPKRPRKLPACNETKALSARFKASSCLFRPSLASFLRSSQVCFTCRAVSSEVFRVLATSPGAIDASIIAPIIVTTDSSVSPGVLSRVLRSSITFSLRSSWAKFFPLCLILEPGCPAASIGFPSTSLTTLFIGIDKMVWAVSDLKPSACFSNHCRTFPLIPLLSGSSCSFL
ncbi:hypothetical protein GOZ97_02640 [Agrobacterium vitis]|nr:hypothetical protein [Allorhizobium ampelinum]MUO92684.1 hypothetical protein [Agrobacterium vitis]MUZ54342.1 hypothetical protein [Agrobacterium vitis]MUZ90305.1 hypothetical protein [Agrobacterium vitis]MVA39080.1 hypothetical protein [Agrobacterium vitis]